MKTKKLLSIVSAALIFVSMFGALIINTNAETIANPNPQAAEIGSVEAIRNSLKLVWNDEFGGEIGCGAKKEALVTTNGFDSDGNPTSSEVRATAKWSHDRYGNNSPVERNGQLQDYVYEDGRNSWTEDGVLHILGQREEGGYKDPVNGKTYYWTADGLRSSYFDTETETSHFQTFRFGMMEARIYTVNGKALEDENGNPIYDKDGNIQQDPKTSQGLWNGFWTYGVPDMSKEASLFRKSSSVKSTWPYCGEIDICEAFTDTSGYSTYNSKTGETNCDENGIIISYSNGERLIKYDENGKMLITDNSGNTAVSYDTETSEYVVAEDFSADYTVSGDVITIVAKKATVQQDENGKTYIVDSANKTMVDTEGNCYGSATKATAQLHYRTAQRYNGSSVTGVTVADKKTTGLGGGYCTSSGKAGQSMHGDTGYHTYGVFWTPTQLFYYCDDMITGYCDITDPQFFQLRECPQVALLTFPIGGSVPGNPNPALDKAEYLVDYVRIYQADDGYNTDPNYQGAYGFPELNDLDQPLSYYSEASDAYSDISIISMCNECDMISNASKSINWGYPFPSSGRVVTISKTGAVIKTLDKFDEGKYDVYIGGIKRENRKDYNFLINGVGIGTELKLSDYSKDKYGREYGAAASAYIGTVDIQNGSHSIEITANEAQTYSSDYRGGQLLSIVLIKNEDSTPTVTLDGGEEDTTITESNTTTSTTKTASTTSNSTSVATTATTSTTEKADENIWFYIGTGNPSKATKTYTKTDYPDATDALQATFDDAAKGSANGGVALSSTAFICVNQDVTLTKQVKYTGSQTMRIKNLYTMTYSPANTENATTAVYGNGKTFYIYGADNAYISGKQFIPYGDNAFFENMKLQCGGYISGDFSVKDCMHLSKLGNYTVFNISGNLILSGKSATSNTANTYNGSGVTIERNFDYSGVSETYKSYVANIASAATINGKVLSEPADPLEVTSVMLEGAAIRLNEQKGIRFVTKLDSDKIAELRAEGATVEYGTLIAPKDLLDGADLTFGLDASKYVDVPYKAEEWHLGVEGQIAGSLVTIMDENIAREFIGRAYVKVTKDGNTKTTYADYASNDVINNTRSLAYVADALKGDTENYDKLNDTIKALVDEWAAKLTK